MEIQLFVNVSVTVMNDGIYDAYRAEKKLVEDEEKLEELMKDPTVKEYVELRNKLNRYYGDDRY